MMDQLGSNWFGSQIDILRLFAERDKKGTTMAQQIAGTITKILQQQIPSAPDKSSMRMILRRFNTCLIKMSHFLLVCSAEKDFDTNAIMPYFHTKEAMFLDCASSYSANN